MTVSTVQNVCLLHTNPYKAASQGSGKKWLFIKDCRLLLRTNEHDINILRRKTFESNQNKPDKLAETKVRSLVFYVIIS